MSKRIEDKKEKESMGRVLFSIIRGVVFIAIVVILIGLLSDTMNNIDVGSKSHDSRSFEIVVSGYKAENFNSNLPTKTETERDTKPVFLIQEQSSSVNLENVMFIGNNNSDKTKEIVELLDKNYDVKIKGSGFDVKKLGGKDVINLDNVDKLEYEINDISGWF